MQFTRRTRVTQSSGNRFEDRQLSKRHMHNGVSSIYLISTNVQQAAAMSRDVVKSLQQPEANEVAWL